MQAVPKFWRPRKRRQVTKSQASFETQKRRIALERFIEALPQPNLLWQCLMKYAVGDDDVQDVDQVLVDSRTFDAVANELAPDSECPCATVVNRSSFEQVALDGSKAPLVGLFSYLAKKLLLLKLRLRLELCSDLCQEQRCVDGVPRLKQDDIEEFILSILPHIRLARDCPPWMVPYFLAHCSTRIMLTTDDLRSRSVPASRVMTSDALNELLALYEVDPADAVATFPVGCDVEVPVTVAEQAKSGQALPKMCDVDPDAELIHGVVVTYEGSGSSLDSEYVICLDGASDSAGPTIRVQREHLFVPSTPSWFQRSVCKFESMSNVEAAGEPNWFSLVTAMKVYAHFCTLDKDNDGMLSEAELAGYNRCSFTELAINRVFQEHITGNDNAFVDYKQFLEFAHATEYPGLRSSTRYFWKILDALGTQTFIHMDVLRRFCIAVSQRLAAENLTEISGDSLLSELVDMVNPAEVDRLTLDDVLRCGHAGTVLPVMLDYRSFYNYETREQQLAPGSENLDAPPAGDT